MLSVIIPAHNEERYIGKCLEALKNQTFKDFEVIVVLNGCTDKTLKIVKKHKVKYYELKEAHVSKARNYGAHRAKNNLLVFMDADIVSEKHFVEKILISEKDFGTCKGKPDLKNFFTFVYSFFKNNFHGIFGVNGVLIVSKDHFKKAGGYNPKLTKKENHDLLAKLKRFKKFKMIDAYVLISMRRFETKGYLKMLFYWFKEILLPSKKRYEVVR